VAPVPPLAPVRQISFARARASPAAQCARPARAAALPAPSVRGWQGPGEEGSAAGGTAWAIYTRICGELAAPVPKSAASRTDAAAAAGTAARVWRYGSRKDQAAPPRLRVLPGPARGGVPGSRTPGLLGAAAPARSRRERLAPAPAGRSAAAGAGLRARIAAVAVGPSRVQRLARRAGRHGSAADGPSRRGLRPAPHTSRACLLAHPGPARRGARARVSTPWRG
jgi:hypothetical protein